MPLDSQPTAKDSRIRSGVPIPPKRSGAMYRVSRIAEQMAVGDCVLAEDIGVPWRAFHEWARKQPMKFTVRKTYEGTMIWRIA